MDNGGSWRGRALLVAVAATVALGASGCSGDGPEPQRAEPPPPETTAAPTTSTSSTTTTTVDPDAPVFEPLLIDPSLDPEAQVEAAYLHYWDVVMDAYYYGRTDHLPLVYSGEALELRVEEIEGFIRDGHHVGGYVEHNYVVNVIGPDEANVIDGYWNNLVKIDPTTKEPISEPSGEQEVLEFQFNREADRWVVSWVVGLRFS